MEKLSLASLEQVKEYLEDILWQMAAFMTETMIMGCQTVKENSDGVME
jgi:hypothetical protein